MKFFEKSVRTWVIDILDGQGEVNLWEGAEHLDHHRRLGRRTRTSNEPTRERCPGL